MHVCNLILAHMYSMHSDLPLNSGVTHLLCLNEMRRIYFHVLLMSLD
jgi:hypothetical protein